MRHPKTYDNVFIYVQKQRHTRPITLNARCTSYFHPGLYENVYIYFILQMENPILFASTGISNRCHKAFDKALGLIGDEAAVYYFMTI